MLSYNIQDNDATLENLVYNVEQGNQVVIARDGKPVAKIVPFNGEPLQKRAVGFMRSIGPIPEDFDTMGAEEINNIFEDDK